MSSKLRTRLQDIFRQKQSTFRLYSEACDRTSDIYNEMNAAWQERLRARDEMNCEYDKIQKSGENYRLVWDEYNRLREEINTRIEALKLEADYEHQETLRCFKRASAEYDYGDKVMAVAFAQEGHDHKDKRDALNTLIGELINEIRDAKKSAETRAPKTDPSKFHRAKATYERAKVRHESIQEDFKSTKAVRDRLKADFNALQTEYIQIKEEFQRELEAEKSASGESDETLVCYDMMSLISD